jgi:hypothetical protein
MGIDVVYPLGKGSRLGNLELKHSLRSLVTHAQNLGRIFIVGEKPQGFIWSDDFVHIPFTETGRAYVNIWHKLSQIASIETITERFVWMNDDFYCLQAFDASSIPYYSLTADLSQREFTKLPIAEVRSDYQRTLKRTYDALTKRGLSTINFGTHQPCNFEKTKIRAMQQEFEPDLHPVDGLSARCCYGNFHAVEQVKQGTILIGDRVKSVAGRFAFATTNSTPQNLAQKLLSRLYPIKTKYEVSNA